MTLLMMCMPHMVGREFILLSAEITPKSHIANLYSKYNVLDNKNGHYSPPN